MKILVIISSFRKQNTYNTVKHIEKIHQGFYSCEYEYLFLKEIDLKPCIGCHLCLTKGEQYCPLKDDRDTIINKIEASDAVILASPNHTKNVNWLMKNYIDRLSYLMHRPRFFKQRFMILITSGSFMGVKEALNALDPIVSGGKIISKLGVMNSPGMNNAKKKKEENKVLNGARQFAEDLRKGFEFKASFLNMLWFSAFKATSEISAHEFPADRKYYENRGFFTEIKLNAYHTFTINLFTNLFKFLLKKGIV